MEPVHWGCESESGDATACFGELNAIHRRGLLIRLALVTATAAFESVAYGLGIIGIRHLEGSLVSGGAILVLGAVSFLVLRAVRSLRLYATLGILDFVSLSIGYTAIIYFLGGIEATYLTPYYAILVTYVGVAATVRVPYLLAAACSVEYAAIVLAEYGGLVPHRNVVERRHLPLENQLAIVAVVALVLFVMAIIASMIRNRFYRHRCDLVLARVRAEASDRAKSEFLATVSHELRTPLTHVLGFAELMEAEGPSAPPEQRAEYLTHILESGKHLLSVIDDVLDLSSVETGRLTMQVSEVTVLELVQSCVAVFADDARAHGIRIESRDDGAPTRIRADWRRLRQLLTNLLSNAVKFSQRDGLVALRLDSWEPSEQDGPPPSAARHWLRISVIDDGIGIDPADLPLLFRPFGRLSGAHAEPGTGLGLALCRRIAEMHGGRIWAESEGRGKGSRFVLVLPVS